MPSCHKRTADETHTRNFCIIAHIDHGKSTLADRLLEITGTVEKRQMRAQILDQMDLERERGITIKMTAVRIQYRAQGNSLYELNLIDTPGHVDFSYEVSRSLAACEGAVLVVDAVQGVQAQTLANVELARDHQLTIVPVINKIDLPAADPDRIKAEIKETLEIDPSECLLASAKHGQGIEEILEAVVQRIPPPGRDKKAPLRALIFDSHYDSYLGTIAYLRVVEGLLKPGMRIRMMGTGLEFTVNGVGFFSPNMQSTAALEAGQVGFFHAGIKAIEDCQVGDTVTGASSPASQALASYRPVKPMVFCGLYPVDSDQFGELRDALSRLRLNDAAFSFEPETSAALGFGFRCGFLGLLHSEIVQERLEREFAVKLVATCPSVVYRIELTSGSTLFVDNPTHWPPVGQISEIQEPYILGTIFTPSDSVGACMELCTERRGTFCSMNYRGVDRVVLTYELPLAEILLDFFDILKSRTRGYASFDYEWIGYREENLSKLDILLNGEQVDTLSFITPKNRAYARGKALANRLKEILPRQMFEIRIQAAIGSKVIAAERIPARRKNVLDKCYGGDVTRKRKLLEKQKKGKRRMKAVGQVEIPQEAFLSVLRVGNE